MIKVFARHKTLNPWERKLHVCLKKDGVTIELDEKDIDELNAVLQGKRNVLHLAPEDGSYTPKEFFLHNHD